MLNKKVLFHALAAVSCTTLPTAKQLTHDSNALASVPEELRTRFLHVVAAASIEGPPRMSDTITPFVERQLYIILQDEVIRNTDPERSLMLTLCQNGKHMVRAARLLTHDDLCLQGVPVAAPERFILLMQALPDTAGVAIEPEMSVIGCWDVALFAVINDPNWYGNGHAPILFAALWCSETLELAAARELDENSDCLQILPLALRQEFLQDLNWAYIDNLTKFQHSKRSFDSKSKVSLWTLIDSVRQWLT